MMFGLIVPDAGTVELLGRELDGLGGEALEEVGGFVEEPTFYPYLSGTANLSLLARLDGGPTAARGRATCSPASASPIGRATASPPTRPG